MASCDDVAWASLSGVTDPTRARLESLTQRWRVRHDGRRGDLEPADAERESLAQRHFPYREMTPAAYADQYGAEMPGFTYDDYRYTDPDLDAWLQELGRLLRERRA